MAKRTRAGRYPTKAALLAAGAAVRAGDYSRASVDRSGREKSISGQAKENGGHIGAHSWSHVFSFSDNDESGADDTREGFGETGDAIRAGKIDVLVLWAIGREARDMAIYSALRNLCLANGVLFWLVGGTLFDLRDKNDRLNLNFQAMIAESYRDALIEAVTRGIATAAADGDPAGGKHAFGYRRVYDPRTGAMIGQVLDDRRPEWLGVGPWWTPADLVAWMFAAFMAGHTLYWIAASLNTAGIPAPRTINAMQKGFDPHFQKGPRAGTPYGSVWREPVIRKILTNPVYLGRRRHNGAITANDCWPPLVDTETFHEVAQELGRPERRKQRDSAARHRLSVIAKCGGTRTVNGVAVPCGLGLGPKNQNGGSYRCARGCVSIQIERLDQYVIATLLHWLSDENEYARLCALGGTDATMVDARARLAELKAEEQQWDHDAAVGPENGGVKQSVYKARMAVLLPQIADAERAVQTSMGMPTVLHKIAGPDVAALFADMDLGQQRAVLRAAVSVTVMPAGQSATAATSERVSVRPAWID